MKDYVIVTDSTSDLPGDLIRELDLRVLPMKFIIGDQEYEFRSGQDQDLIGGFYDSMKDNKTPRTSQINVGDYYDFFEGLVRQGLGIVYIGFSSSLSGTYNSSLLARQMVLENYGDARLDCIDSRAASLGLGLLVYWAGLKRQEGLGQEELVDWVEKRRDQVCHYFTVEDLKYLYQGGRISKTDLVLGRALKIKPLIHVDLEGRLVGLDKSRGRKKSLRDLVDRMRERGLDLEDQPVFIGHGDDLEGLEYIKGLIIEEFGAREFVTNYIGPIVGAHSGPGTIALFFYGDK